MARRRQTSQLLLTDVDADKAMTSEGFDRLLRLHLEAERSTYPARAWYPSSVGHPCDRYSVFRFTRWKEQSPVSATLQAIFDQGNDIQPLIIERLEQLGYGVTHESDRPMQYEPRPGVLISGRADGKLVSWRGEKYNPKRVLEVKSASSWVFNSINTIEDIKHHPNFRVRGYYAQGNLYAFLEDLPHGAIVIYDKATGMLKLIPFDLDYEEVERMLAKIERLAPMIRERRDPPPIPYDLNICRGCEFAGICYPARSYGEGAQVLTDAAILKLLERWWQLRQGGREYKHVDADLKEWLKHQGISFAVAEDFIIEGTQRSDGAIVYSIDKLGAVDEGAA